MAESFGWVGKILRVDLDSGSITTEDTSKYTPDFLGGKGIAYKIAWDELPVGTGPFDPANLLMFFTGPCAGTLAPTSGRGIICGVSPKTYPKQWFTYGGIGGDWTAELKYAGYDGIVVKGNSEEPVYLDINDGEVTLKSAEALWGRDAETTQILLANELGKKTQVVTIGPAGENKVFWASIQHHTTNAAGSVGLGGVMGAKKLKAIAIRGTGSVKIAKPQEFLSLALELADHIKYGAIYSTNGRLPGPGNIPCSNACPVGCAGMRKDVPAGVTLGSGTRTSLKHCVDGEFIGGDKRSEYPGAKIADSYDGEIFTKQTIGFGNEIGTELQMLTNQLGLSAWTAYENLSTWFNACIDNGSPTLAGETLAPSDPVFWRDILTKIAYRQGLGDYMADGLMYAADRLNVSPLLKKYANWQEPMWGMPAHREGRGLESQRMPIWVFTMLAWVMGTRDPMASHHASSFIETWLYNGDPDKLALTLEKGMGPGTGAGLSKDFENIDAKTKIAIWFHYRSQMKDSLLLCDWAFPRLYNPFGSKEEFQNATDYLGDVDAEAKLFSAITGVETTTAEIQKAGERISNLERALHVKHWDRSRAVDTTGEWIFEYPEKTDGTKLDMAMFNTIADSYYQNRGWDKASGRPTRAKLEELGLKSVADELQTLGKLP